MISKNVCSVSVKDTIATDTNTSVTSSNTLSMISVCHLATDTTSRPSIISKNFSHIPL